MIFKWSITFSHIYTSNLNITKLPIIARTTKIQNFQLLALREVGKMGLA